VVTPSQLDTCTESDFILHNRACPIHVNEVFLKKYLDKSEHGSAYPKGVDMAAVTGLIQVAQYYARTHKALMDKYKQTLKPQQHEMYNFLNPIVRKIFSRGVNVSSIGVYYAFIGEFAKHCTEQNDHNSLSKLPIAMRNHSSTYFSQWVFENGGWKLFQEAATELEGTVAWSSPASLHNYRIQKYCKESKQTQTLITSAVWYECEHSAKLAADQALKLYAATETNCTLTIEIQHMHVRPGNDIGQGKADF